MCLSGMPTPLVYKKDNYNASRDAFKVDIPAGLPKFPTIKIGAEERT